MDAGDVVALRSGGPMMTIHSVGTGEQTGTVFCHWFDDNGDLKGHRFRVEALQVSREISTPDGTYS